jgi:putative ABC transport system permease protein
MLRAIGMTRAQARQAIRWESVLICVFGAALGIVMGLAFGLVAVSALSEEVPAVPTVPAGIIAAVVLASAAAGALAAVLPARRVGRLDVLDAIGRVS